MSLFIQGALLIWGLVTILWIISVIAKNVSIVDVFWGMGYVILNAFYVLTADEITPRDYLIFGLVSIWGLRLSIYLAFRNIGKGEDFRYQEFRRKYGAHRYWWFSYFQTFLLQGALILIVSLPLLGIRLSESSGELTILDIIGIFVWLIGFSFEAGGDYQLSQFKKNPDNKGKVLDSGFWKYTRHPNYFGDSTVWWAYAIICMASGSYGCIVGSLVMTLLIIKVSGVALLEKSLKTSKPQYREYIEKTSSFFPWFLKETKTKE